jgi:predicted small integral membrane protein
LRRHGHHRGCSWCCSAWLDTIEPLVGLDNLTAAGTVFETATPSQEPRAGTIRYAAAAI